MYYRVCGQCSVQTGFLVIVGVDYGIHGTPFSVYNFWKSLMEASYRNFDYVGTVLDVKEGEWVSIYPGWITIDLYVEFDVILIYCGLHGL